MKDRITSLSDLNECSDRSQKYSIDIGNNLHFDFSKNYIDDKGLSLLDEIYKIAKIKDWYSFIDDAQALVNFTEKRAVTLRGLRSKLKREYISSYLLDAYDFVDDVRTGFTRGYNGSHITDIVNIGVGGSDLGSLLTTNALDQFNDTCLDFHFVSCLDGSNLESVLKKVKLESTIFIVASKTFTTRDTLISANKVKRLLEEDSDHGMQNMIGISADPCKMSKFGILDDNQFQISKTVGGRYSVSSAMAIPLMLMIGRNRFDEFLEGMQVIDETIDKPMSIPFVMAVLAAHYSVHRNYRAHAILPYSYNLRNFADYIAQLSMESLGKTARYQGEDVSTKTGQVIFGGIGTNSQHSFYQMLHQGTDIIPCDFIVAANTENDNENDILNIANCLAQSEALMNGQDCKNSGHSYYGGQRPSSTIVLNELNPKTLGMLISIYEHKTIMEGILYGINPFDQMGVELGKSLCKIVENKLEDDFFDTISSDSTASTDALITIIKKYREK